jgi:hypothetical protein
MVVDVSLCEQSSLVPRKCELTQKPYVILPGGPFQIRQPDVKTLVFNSLLHREILYSRLKLGDE